MIQNKNNFSNENFIKEFMSQTELKGNEAEEVLRAIKTSIE
jgi:hypothetical protein